MIRETIARYAKRLALGLAAIAVAATPSFAQTSYDLCATTGNVTMPDTTSVPIWSYVAGDCTTGSGTAVLPGPVLRATAGETLTIVVHNDLSVSTSFFAPGLRPDTPNDGSGVITSEAAANGGTVTYTFAGIKAGTYLYHSGTDIRTQVPMGLYGALVVDVAAGQAYGDVSYAQDEVLVYSEIDPNLNADPAGFGGARVIHWSPQYFLINGAAYPDTGSISVNTSQDTVLRFVNAGLQTFVPTLDGGLYMDLVAEDANRYPQPFQQYGIELPAGKTIDAIINPGTDGTYALYDRALHLTNGGLLTYLEAGAAAGAPTAANDPATAGEYTIAEDTPADALTVTAPGVLGNDSTDPPGGTLTAILVAGTANGALALAGDGSFTYTPDADFNGTDTFTYMANDGTLDSNVATATITVSPVDDPPVANDDAATTPPNVAVDIDVVANDTDPDGNLDPTTVSVTTPAANGAAVSNGNGTVTYTPNADFAGVDSFNYQICDTGSPALCATALVTITVINSPPFAANDFAATTRNSAGVTFSVTANDVDSDGTIDGATVVITSGPTASRGGTVVNHNDGTVTFIPKRGFRGTDTFTYTVNDNVGATSNVATVRVNVN